MAKAKQNFVAEVKREVGKVVWPTRRETMLTSIMVFIMVVIMSVFLFTVDQLWTIITQWILGIGN
jgi:preprotein translocase subunit SecE